MPEDEANGQEVAIDLPDGTDPTTIVVFLTPQAIFHAAEPGTYTATPVIPDAPDDCAGETLDTSVSVQGNLDADLLEGVTRIQGNLTIVRSTLTFSYIDNIANVDAFASIEEIGGNLVVNANLDLVSLSGFDQLTTVDGGLYVRSNPLLSECLPLELRNRLEDGGFDGAVGISGNLADTCD